VLIVDASRDTREILRTLLDRCGAEILEAPGPHRGSELVRQHRPDVIVLDEDADASPAGEATAELGRAASVSCIPIVILGTAVRPHPPLPTGELLAKPYQYDSLIRRIEELLGSRG
jgi:CheY-like chemotaxis protein